MLSLPKSESYYLNWQNLLWHKSFYIVCLGSAVESGLLLPFQKKSTLRISVSGVGIGCLIGKRDSNRALIMYLKLQANGIADF